MVQQVVNVGTQANDATGDLLRDAFTKINTNFAALFAGNFPAAQLTVGPPVSGTALSVIGLSGQSAISTTIGTVVIGSPTSGIALTVNGVGSTVTSLFAGATGGPSIVGIQDGQAGTTRWYLTSGLTAVGDFEISNSTGGNTPIKITSTGAISMPAPTSAVSTLTISGASGATAINATAFSATDIALAANGNVALGASSLSTITLNGAITASGANGGTVLKLNAAAGTTAAIFDSTNAAGPDIRWSNSGTTFGFMGSWLDLIGSGNNSDLLIRSNNSFGLAAGGGTVRFQVASTGGVSVNAPTSGDALTVTNVAGANALTLAGNSAGTAVLRLNTQATTGAQTATFAANNKPGSGTTGPDKWIPINLDGTTHYVPAFL